MNPNRLILAICFVLCFYTAISQSDFREGYVVNLQNDTIAGYIDYKGNLRTLDKCRFKVDKQADTREYTPDEIQSFRVYSGGYYVALEIELNDKKKKVFIEQLVEGIVDVFYYTEFNVAHYLARTDDGEFYELKNTKKDVVIDNNTYSMDKKEYVGVLKHLFRDSPSIYQKLDKLSYTPNSLTDIALEYHNEVCNEYECVVYTKEKLKMKFDFGVMCGFSVSDISMKSDYFPRMENNFSKSSNTFFGLSLNLMHPGVSQRIGLELDFIWQNGKYVFDSTYYDMKYLKIPLILNYTYPAHKLKPSLQMGVSYNYWLKHDAENIIPDHVIGEPFQKRTYQYGFLLGAKVAYELSKNLDVYFNIRYEIYNGKPWNIYGVPDAFGSTFSVSESVETKIDFITYVIGFHF